LVAGGWFVLREKYYCLLADKPSEQCVGFLLNFREMGWQQPVRYPKADDPRRPRVVGEHWEA
jgi:hypothetical protein